ncbi:hypothetical protein GUITHDRAFT_114513 [Guillardia theta CCMP2712]|uniref:Uncharacterized protein n=1 Tax=Guillardia theta (strain CCMP2712) TaxID=905079 RepID=L1IST6_GUITC|nr:hypothetical protein GUITHDRAFT_114513 [Guillardia theta CCMP2712]EKX39311.1 hypothetical protein GUITHDRAFT_114513 [Guillardia theta CCMP2712]|eukprot:XP_005826291.1 hypothetical protein GUITHDRAFT_114513 [Guillardia theta CCMP2712]
MNRNAQGGMEGYGSASLWPQASAPQGGFGGIPNDNFVGGFQGGLDASPQLWNQNSQSKMPQNSMPQAGFGSFVPQLRLGNTSAPPFVPMVDANKGPMGNPVGNANAKRPNVSLGMGVGGLGSNSPQLAWDGILGPNGVPGQGGESGINTLSSMSSLNNPSASQARKPGPMDGSDNGPMNARQILQAAQKLENALMNGWITPEQAQDQASKFQAMLSKVNAQPMQDFASPAGFLNLVCSSQSTVGNGSFEYCFTSFDPFKVSQGTQRKPKDVVAVVVEEEDVEGEGKVEGVEGLAAQVKEGGEDEGVRGHAKLMLAAAFAGHSRTHFSCKSVAVSVL